MDRMDYRPVLPSSLNGFRRPEINGNSAQSRQGIVKPSFASSTSSALPASLGLGPSTSLSQHGLGDRPRAPALERRTYSDGGPSYGRPPNAPGGSGFLQGASSGFHNPMGNGSSLPMSSGWNRSTGAIRRTPIPGLPAGAQMVESNALPSSSRNFLVPIGATGARQKLSIANASQRKKMASSDEVRWPTGPPADPTFGKTADAILSSSRQAGGGAGGLVNGESNALAHPTLPRSRSKGLVKPLGSDAARENGFANGLGQAPSNRGSDDASLFEKRSLSDRPMYLGSISRSSTSQQSTNAASPASSPVNERSNQPPLDVTAAESMFASSHIGSSNGAQSTSAANLVDRSSTRSTTTAKAQDKAGGSLQSQQRQGRPLTSTEILQAARERELAKNFDISPSQTRSSKEGESSGKAVNGDPAAQDGRFDSLLAPVAASKAEKASTAAHPDNGQAHSVTPKASANFKSAGTKNPIKGIFGRRDTSSESAAEPFSEGTARLMNAEVYKQNMLERDLAQSSATVERDRGSGRSNTDIASASQQVSGPVSQKAPMLDLELPKFSFFDMNDPNSDQSGASLRKTLNRSSNGEDDDHRRSLTGKSDTSIGSFEGSYVHPGSTDAPAESSNKLLPAGGTITLEDIYGAGSTKTAGPQESTKTERAAKAVSRRPPQGDMPDQDRPLPAIPHTRSASIPKTSSEGEAEPSRPITPKMSSPPPKQTNGKALTTDGRGDVASKLAVGSALEDSLATPNKGQAAAASSTAHQPTKPARSKGRPASIPTKSVVSAPSALGLVTGLDDEVALLAEGATAAEARDSFSKPRRSVDPATYVPPDALSVSRRGETIIQVREPARGLADGQADTMVCPASWQRNADSYAMLSPDIRQSRFSKVSTDASDSRTPTRLDHRLSGLSDTLKTGDDLEDELSMDGQQLPTSAWAEVENALRRFRERAPAASADRGNLLRTVLLPFLALEAETASVDVVGSGPFVSGKARRALFFDWIRFLLLELQHVQTSADRGAILESIACIIESRNFSVGILNQDPEDEARFSSVFGHILSYAIGELNKKGVYQNTLIFSGRLLAVAFFRVQGVASKLLRALPVNRFALERVAKEAGWQQTQPADFDRFCSKFPGSLRQLCFKDARSYLKMLDNESVSAGTEAGAEDDRFLVRQPEVEVEMTGNWLRRWQSDDSELFFSFCRSYHRQLACLFSSSKVLDSVSKHFFGGPGYAHLATCVHQKCLALVHRVILSVTTLSSQKNFNPAGETANVLLGSTAGKPRILEAANRRCTAIVVDIVRAPSGGNMIFAPMLGLHIKSLIKRTSLYDVQGVFCLFDWLDGVLGHMDQADLLNEGLIDISFIITTIGLLLEDADHALALMRTIAFCYANFGVLTATKENRVRFCEEILLKPKVFTKLFLSWSFTIRAYFLHLLVFRLARINDFAPPKEDPSGKTAISITRLFNNRLEEIRKRHDQLSPTTDSSSDGDKSEDEKTKHKAANSFISTIKKNPSITGVEPASGRSKAERLLGISPSEPTSPKTDVRSQSKKAKNWLKALRGGKNGKSGTTGGVNGSPTAQELAGGSTRSRMTALDEVVSSDDESETPGSVPGSPRPQDEDSMSDASTLDGSILGPPAKLNAFEIEFASKSPKEGAVPVGHEAGIAQDTAFDLQSSIPHLPSLGGKSQSPRVSRAFSKRSSILPGPASELMNWASLEPVPDLPTSQLSHVYEEQLHIYAVQSLREYEQTVQEHDEFFASLPEDQGAQVPRLPVNWPAMWSSTGE